MLTRKGTGSLELEARGTGSHTTSINTIDTSAELTNKEPANIRSQ